MTSGTSMHARLLLPPPSAAAPSPRDALAEEEASAPAVSPQPPSPAARTPDDHSSPHHPATEIDAVRPSPSPLWASSPLSTAPQSPTLLSPVSGPSIRLAPSTSASEPLTQPRPMSPLSPSFPSSAAPAAAPTRVKLSLRDFLLRKKKQREGSEVELSKTVQASPLSVSLALGLEGEGERDVEVGGGSTGAGAGADEVLGVDGRCSEEEKEKVEGFGVIVHEEVEYGLRKERDEMGGIKSTMNIDSRSSQAVKGEDKDVEMAPPAPTVVAVVVVVPDFLSVINAYADVQSQGFQPGGSYYHQRAISATAAAGAGSYEGSFTSTTFIVGLAKFS